MTDITATTTFLQAEPTLECKKYVMTTSSAAATGDTIDMTGYMTTVKIVYICDSTGAVKVATYSGLTITLGTITTGVHHLEVTGTG